MVETLVIMKVFILLIIVNFPFIKDTVSHLHLQCMVMSISLNPHQLGLSNFLYFVNLVKNGLSVYFLISYSYE